MKDNKLIPMTDYVLEQEKQWYEMTPAEVMGIFNYANFLKLLLKLWMFVPCDVDVLKEPDEDNSKYWNVTADGNFNHGLFNEDIEQYQQAKERVLFHSMEELPRTKRQFLSWTSYNNYKTVECIIKYNVTLTPNALKQIGL